MSFQVFTGGRILGGIQAPEKTTTQAFNEGVTASANRRITAGNLADQASLRRLREAEEARLVADRAALEQFNAGGLPGSDAAIAPLPTLGVNTAPGLAAGKAPLRTEVPAVPRPPLGFGGAAAAPAAGGNGPHWPQTLRTTESGGRWDAKNNATGAGGVKGHFGQLQFSVARLQEAKAAGIMPANMTPEQFLEAPAVQEAVADWHFGDIDQYIAAQGLAKYLGTEVLGVPVTLSGMQAVAHLGGKGGLRKFLTSAGEYNPNDGKTSLADYLRIHGSGGGYNPGQVDPKLLQAAMRADPQSAGLLTPNQIPALSAPPEGAVHADPEAARRAQAEDAAGRLKLFPAAPEVAAPARSEETTRQQIADARARTPLFSPALPAPVPGSPTTLDIRLPGGEKLQLDTGTPVTDGGAASAVGAPAPVSPELSFSQAPVAAPPAGGSSAGLAAQGSPLGDLNAAGRTGGLPPETVAQTYLLQPVQLDLDRRRVSAARSVLEEQARFARASRDGALMAQTRAAAIQLNAQGVYLDGMQAIIDFSAGNPDGLNGAFSQMSGGRVKLLAIDDGTFNVVSDNQTVGTMTRDEVITTARLAFDQTYQAQVAASIATDVARSDAFFDSQLKSLVATQTEEAKGNAAVRLELIKDKLKALTGPGAEYVAFNTAAGETIIYDKATGTIVGAVQVTGQYLGPDALLNPDGSPIMAATIDGFPTNAIE